jgi:hypothetical protein
MTVAFTAESTSHVKDKVVRFIAPSMRCSACEKILIREPSTYILDPDLLITESRKAS